MTAPSSVRDLITAQLSALPEFEKFGAATCSELAEKGQWYCVPGGNALFAQGAAANRFFIVLSGRLIVVRQVAGQDQVIGYVRAGEMVGEMALLSGEPHSASVYTLRDTEVLCLEREAFTDLFEEHADFASGLARTILARTRHPTSSFQQASPRVFALVCTSPSIDIDAIAGTLSQQISGLGKTVSVLTDEALERAESGFHGIEREADITLLMCRVEDSPWYRFVLRHADRFFVFARHDARPPQPFPLSPGNVSPARKFRLVDLVMIEEGRHAGQGAIPQWVAAVEANRVFPWEPGPAAARLARVIAGKTLGLVLSGGGARAYAHIGVVKHLREAGFPIDFVSGASMGAVIAACVAMGWDDAEIEERIRDAFVRSNPLGDHVLPVVALTRGRLVEERLEKHFGDICIEELKVPYFCISSELTEGVERVHRRGVLRHALRASISLPGILPPVVDGDQLLVDGAVINNFPTTLMKDLHRGLTIGVDVARRGTISAEDYIDPPGFIRWVRQHGIRSTPPIVPLLMRSASARQSINDPADDPDILIEPKVPDVGIRDWRSFEQAVEDGREAARRVLEGEGAELSHFKVLIG
ncbi:MAG: patatin-like phospholipase family protein [Pseudomonadota bacterium]